MTRTQKNGSSDYDPDQLDLYLKTKPDASNDELYSLCNATTDSQKGYIRKKKSRLLSRMNDDESLEESSESNPSKVYTKKEVKQSFQESPQAHVIDLLKQYPELPLFIYSQIFDRVHKDYHKVLEKLNTESKDTVECKELDYSFYDYFIEIYESISEGKLDKEVREYMKDSTQSYGETWCRQMYELPFNKEKLEERTYWTEEEAQKWREKQLENTFICENCGEEHPVNEGMTEDQKQRWLEWIEEYSRDMVINGSYAENYIDALNEVLESISKVMTYTQETLKTYENYYKIRSEIVFFLMINLNFTVFDMRPKEYVKADLQKHYIESRRYRPGLSLRELFRLYDERWVICEEKELTILKYPEDSEESDLKVQELEQELYQVKNGTKRS